MRVYKRTDRELGAYTYPVDMGFILDYLSEHGTLYVSGRTVERLYREFSEECWSAGWISVTPKRLDEFADWLERVEE